MGGRGEGEGGKVTVACRQAGWVAGWLCRGQAADVLLQWLIAGSMRMVVWLIAGSMCMVVWLIAGSCVWLCG